MILEKNAVKFMYNFVLTPPFTCKVVVKNWLLETRFDITSKPELV